MGLDVKLSEEDLADVRVVLEPRPVMEPLMAAHLLLQATSDPYLLAWRTETVRTLGPAAAPALQAMLTPPVMIGSLITRHDVDAPDLATALDRFASTPGSLVRSNVDHLVENIPPGRWTALRDARAGDLRTVTRVVQMVADAAVGPLAAAVHAATVAAGRRIAVILATEGPGAALNALHPTIRWNPPYLTFSKTLACPPGCAHHVNTMSEWTAPLTLRGRGLRLVPVAFSRGPSFGAPESDEDPPAHLEFPAAPDWSFVVPGPASAERLGPLLGLTRASILEAVADGPLTTTALARRAGTAASSASEHATVLRQAGLVRTTRTAQGALHELTPLGRALLEGLPPVDLP